MKSGQKCLRILFCLFQVDPAPHVSEAFSQQAFIESLGLTPCSQAVPETPSKKPSVDAMIDLTEDPVPKTPITPRLQKSCSMLSGSSSPGAAQRNLFGEPKESEEESSEGSEEEEDDEEEEDEDDERFKIKRINKILTSVDLTSPLGEFVRQHVPEKVTYEPKELEYESSCRTSGVDSSSSKLRERHSGFPVTFKKKKGPDVFCHRYSFNKADKREFFRRLITGLSKESRMLLKKTNRCRLRVKNLTKEEVKKLSIVKTPKPIELQRPRAPLQSSSPSFFPNLTSQLFPHGLSNVSASLTPNPLAIYQQAQQQRQLEMQRLMQQRMQYSNSSTAAMQQRMLLNQRIMAAAAAATGSPIPNNFNAGFPSLPKSQFRANPGPYRSQPTRPQQRPARPKRPRPKVDSSEDVITLSSSEDEDEAPASRKPCRDSQNARLNVNRPKPATPASDLATNVDSQAVMFKCHLCGAEILFTQSTTMYIREHFAQSHGIKNVQILHNVDQNNQVTFSIIEGPEQPAPPPKSVPNILNRPQRPLAPRAAPKRPPLPAPPAEDSDDVICIDW